MKILHPDRVDVPSPHSTIYRKIASELSHDCYAFAEPGYDSELNDEITVLEVESETKDKIWRYTKEYLNDYDIIHTGPVSHVLLSILSREVTDTSVIHTVHTTGELSEEYGLANSIFRRLMVDRADEVTAVSEFLGNHIRSHYDRGPIVVPNGVDLDAYTPENAPTSESMCLFVGRFVKRKHPEIVLSLARSLPSVEFKMVGSGTMFPTVKDRVDSFNNVEVFSWIDNTELSRLYAEASVALCPYESEAFGMVVIEAMASGTPVVGLDDGNLSRLIRPGQNGTLCQKLDTDEWKTAIKSVTESIRQLSPRESVQKYSWDHIARQYDQVYRSVVSN